MAVWMVTGNFHKLSFSFSITSLQGASEGLTSRVSIWFFIRSK